MARARRKLGDRFAIGTLDNSGFNPYGNGFWAVTFDPEILAMGTNDFEVYHIAVKGPSGSSLQMYHNRTFYDATSAGDLNSWDPQHPLEANGGDTIYLYWNTGTAPAPQVTIFLQQPE